MIALKDPVMQLHRGVLVIFLLVASAEIASSQSLIHGKVLTLDSIYIAAAHVTLRDAAGNLKSEILTDSAGEFRFRIANQNGTVTLYLSVVSLGYVSIDRVPVRVGEREDVVMRVLMSPTVLSIAPVTVVTRRRHRSTALTEYYQRVDDVARGTGRALERDVMERYAGLELIRALHNVPGVQQGRVMLPSGITLTVPRMSNGCIPLTYVDRVPVAPEELATMDPADLEGVIVYVGGVEIPPDFSRLMTGTECGLILAYRVAPAQNRIVKPVIGAAVILGAFAAIVLSVEW